MRLTTNLTLGHTMFTFQLKTGETVQVAEDDLENFIEQNRHLIKFSI